MRTPNEFELQHMLDGMAKKIRDHQYYEEHKKLKGRRKGQANEAVAVAKAKVRGSDPRTGKQKAQIHEDARTKQRKELSTQINNLEGKLKKLEALIRKTEHIEKSKDHKSAAKKERAAKEADKPKSAAEKAKAARESKKYKDKNQQKVKSAAKKDGGSASKSNEKSKAKSKTGLSSADFKVLAKKVRGKIAVAKQKLAAL